MQRVSQHSKQRGFTLVEALITAIVMAVGLLGLAGLQIAGMKSNHSAYLRSQATIASYDLLDRMRANPGSFVGKHFTSDDDSGVEEFEDWKAVLAGLPEQADADVPQAEVNCLNSAFCGDGNCEIVIRWNDSRGERTDEATRQGVVETLTFGVCSRLPI